MKEVMLRRLFCSFYINLCYSIYSSTNYSDVTHLVVHISLHLCHRKVPLC